MKKQIESIVLENDKKQKLRINSIGSTSFCIEVEGDYDYFEFKAEELIQIIDSINSVVTSSIEKANL